MSVLLRGSVLSRIVVGILVLIFCTLTEFSIFEIVGAHSRTQVFQKSHKNIVLTILLATTRQDDWGWSWAMLDADSIRLPSAIRESTDQDL